jgi:hypothetical protein
MRRRAEKGPVQSRAIPFRCHQAESPGRSGHEVDQGQKAQAKRDAGEGGEPGDPIHGANPVARVTIVKIEGGDPPIGAAKAELAVRRAGGL